MVLPEPDYTFLFKAVREVCSGAGLRANNYFMDKIQQVYETMRVRHGFMLVGNPIGGKTVALRTLAKALGIMNDRVSVRKSLLSILGRGDRESVTKSFKCSRRVNVMNLSSSVVSSFFFY